MFTPRALLVLVDARCLELVTRYVLEPRKRASVALDLADLIGGARGAQHSAERAAAISVRLDGVVAARTRAIESADGVDTDEYATRLWREVAWIGAAAGTSWHQGVGRSLGMLAYPERFVLAETPSSVSHLVRAVRHLVTTTAQLAPELALPGWEHALPAWGRTGAGSGAVPLSYAEWLSGLVSGTQWPLAPLAEHLFGARMAAEWRTTVSAAARSAIEARAHLIEVDVDALRARRSTPPPALPTDHRSGVRSLRSLGFRAA